MAESQIQPLNITDEEYLEYVVRLARLAEQNLCDRLKRRVDAEDLAMSAIRTFIRRRETFSINTTSELWALLVTITIRKVRRDARRAEAGIRDVRKEVRADDLPLCSSIPGPDDQAALADAVEHVLGDLKPVHAEIFDLRLAGHTNQQIADQVGISLRGVNRAISLFRERFQKLYESLDE